MRKTRSPKEQIRNGFWDANGDLALPSARQATEEEQMWQGVILQAFIDACWEDPRPDEIINWTSKNRNRMEARIECGRARAWLKGDTADFLNVCEMAGINPDAVVATALRCEHLGWPRCLLPDRHVGSKS